MIIEGYVTVCHECWRATRDIATTPIIGRTISVFWDLGLMSFFPWAALGSTLETLCKTIVAVFRCVFSVCRSDREACNDFKNHSVDFLVCSALTLTSPVWMTIFLVVTVISAIDPLRAATLKAASFDYGMFRKHYPNLSPLQQQIFKARSSQFFADILQNSKPSNLYLFRRSHRVGFIESNAESDEYNDLVDRDHFFRGLSPTLSEEQQKRLKIDLCDRDNQIEALRIKYSPIPRPEARSDERKR
ncbi:MAG: hypothetical protein H0X51_02735 [Parachlamydiaceae bacterium]|nr:hypothetical protein [Parachlamydiaceae bacterium]